MGGRGKVATLCFRMADILTPSRVVECIVLWQFDIGGKKNLRSRSKGAKGRGGDLKKMLFRFFKLNWGHPCACRLWLALQGPLQVHFGCCRESFDKAEGTNQLQPVAASRRNLVPCQNSSPIDPIVEPHCTSHKTASSDHRPRSPAPPDKISRLLAVL